MYVIVWKYKVEPEKREKFEKTYGPEGLWADFFRTSAYYRGTCLFKSEKASDVYMLLDFWKTKEAYDHFTTTQADTYQQLSLQFQDVYQEETRMDEYYAVH